MIKYRSLYELIQSFIIEHDPEIEVVLYYKGDRIFGPPSSRSKLRLDDTDWEFSLTQSSPELEAMVRLVFAWGVEAVEALEEVSASLLYNTDQTLSLYELLSLEHDTFELDQLLKKILPQLAQLLDWSQIGLALVSQSGESLIQYALGIDGDLTSFSGMNFVHQGREHYYTESQTLRNGTLLRFVAWNVAPELWDIPKVEFVRVVLQVLGGFADRVLLLNEMLEAKQHEAELKLAQRVQQNLLPLSSPELAGWEIRFDYQPARNIGGDFYNYTVQKDQQGLWLFLADVCGKGAPAALIASTVNTALMSYFSTARGRCLDTERSVLNFIQRELQKVQLLTTLYLAHVDLETGKVSALNFGHVPVYLWHPERGLEFLKPSDPPLGLQEIQSLSWEHYFLEPGSVLLGLTDGFHESFRPSGEMWGLGGLEQWLEASLTQYSLTELITEAYTTFGFGRDDRAVIALRRESHSD